MVTINVKKTTMVKPAEKTPRRWLRLSILDRMNNHPLHNTFVQFYRPLPNASAGDGDGDSDFFAADILRESLSKVLVAFYPMAGRYRATDDGLGIEIDCNGEGVLFVEAESSFAIDDFGHFAPSPELRKLVPAVDYSGGVSSYPLLLAQITYFKCGGVSLGIAMEHHAVDGSSAFHIINSWSEIARGLDISVPPFLDRSILRPRNPPKPKFNHIEYRPASSTNKIISQQNTAKPRHDQDQSVKSAVFKMTKDQLNIMKSKSNVMNYSTFEILAGHTWKCVCKARAQPYDQETTLYSPLSGRSPSRLMPRLPPGFFGNAIFAATSVALSGDLQSKPLSYAVRLIHETLVKMDNGYLRSAIDYLALQPDISLIRRGAHTYLCPNLGITSWSNIGMHDADFGWGKPCYAGPTELLFEGKSYIIPSAGDDGSLTLAIALHDEHLKVFEKLFYEYV